MEIHFRNEKKIPDSEIKKKFHIKSDLKQYIYILERNVTESSLIKSETVIW